MIQLESGHGLDSRRATMHFRQAVLSDRRKIIFDNDFLSVHFCVRPDISHSNVQRK